MKVTLFVCSQQEAMDGRKVFMTGALDIDGEASQGRVILVCDRPFEHARRFLGERWEGQHRGDG
jgi:hypothetical protein